MKNMYTFEKNKKILDKWYNHDISKGEISPDGVYYKGKTYTTDYGQVWRELGKEDEQWNTSSRRILFISKDPNEVDNPYDMRGPDLTQNPDGTLSFGCRFNNNLLRITAGLHTISESYYEPYETINSIQKLNDIWQQAAVARINVKKHSGGNRISNSELKKWIKEYKTFILEQISLLDPHIIICCGGNGIIKEFVISEYLKEKDSNNLKSPDDNWIYYSSKYKKWVIDSYHLNPYGNISDHDLYHKIMMFFKNSLNRNIGISSNEF